MDLYNIPGDNGKNYRLKKFVEYQHEVPSIHYRVLGEYAKKLKLDKDETVMMCWFMSCTYNEITCAFLHEKFLWKTLNPKTVRNYCRDFWDKYKEDLIFGSARVYAKSMDWFPVLMENFIRHTKNRPYRWLKHLCKPDPAQTYYSIIKELEEFHYVGRFARDLFMESIMYLQDYVGIEIVEPEILDWGKCGNLTSGILNIFYLDEEANEFDKTGKIPDGVTKAQLSEYLDIVRKEIHRTYPEQDDDINLFVGKVCSFRNLFKNSRYGGFHHDRELGWLIQYQEKFPELNIVWENLFNLRAEMFSHRFLGEFHDWSDIRRERKKLWLTYGLTGVEKDDINTVNSSQRLLVNIRGTNGSGKSTIPISMKDDPDMYEVSKPYQGKPKKILTVFPNYGWVALGDYSNPTGGLDKFPNKAFTEKALHYALKKFPEYNVLMEGILAATTYSTYADLFRKVKESYGIQPVVYYLMPPVETCIERIKKRNGGKEFKENLVRDKYRMMERGIEKFKNAGEFPVVVVDNSNVDKTLVRDQFFAELEGIL